MAPVADTSRTRLGIEEGPTKMMGPSSSSMRLRGGPLDGALLGSTGRLLVLAGEEEGQVVLAPLVDLDVRHLIVVVAVAVEVVVDGRRVVPVVPGLVVVVPAAAVVVPVVAPVVVVPVVVPVVPVVPGLGVVHPA